MLVRKCCNCVKVVNKQMQHHEFVRGDSVLHSKSRMNYSFTTSEGFSFFHQLKHFCLEMCSDTGRCGLKCTDPPGHYI